MKNITSIKNLLLAAGLGIMASTAVAQTVSYNIVENEPDKKNLFVYINPFNVQAYSPDITIGFDVQATWLAAKHIQLQLDFRKAYLDGNATGIFSPKGLKKSSQIELGGAFNLRNRIKNVSHKVVLSSFSSGRYTYTKSIKVRAEARKLFAARGGFVTYFSNYKVGNGSGGEAIKGKTGDGITRSVYDSLTFETINFTGRSVGIYAGLDFKTLRSLLIDADGYGEKSCKTVNNFYLDVLFTPLVVYSLKPNNGQSSFKDVNINISDNKRKMLGWRLGWQWSLNRTVGYNAKMEIGQQPGIAGKGFFVSLGFGMTLGLKTKQLPI